MLLSLDGVEAGYGSAKVLHRVELELDEGEFLCIVGRNGAGKTTLLRTVAGFIRPFAGRIFFRGERIDGQRPEVLARKGLRYVSQDKKVFAKLTVRENIELAAFGCGLPAEEAIERVIAVCPWLKRFLGNKAGGLSGGQRQLFLIALALLGDPRLVLLDEPTEGLAAGVIEDIGRILLERKGRLSLIVVEQNLDLVERLADRVYIMQEGHARPYRTNEGGGWSRADLEAVL
ncbi:MAG: ABC transporter ATP-binding protein [Bacillota bacterium]